MKRRDFLKGLGAAALLPWHRALAQAQEAPMASKHLVLDSRVIDRVEGAALTLGKVQKDPRNPLFIEDKERPWEVRFDNLYANVLYDEEDQLYKCWYSPFIVWGKTREMAICYATSKDGIAWEKPDLGLVDFDGSKKNNIVVRGPHGAGIRKDLRDPDPERRYKMFFNQIDAAGRHSAMAVAFSRDGIHWSPPVSCPEIAARGDTHNNFFWSTQLGKWVGITRLFDGQRIVGRTESADFRKWAKAVEVLRGTKERQTYAMPAFEYANVVLGLLMVYNTKENLVDCELAWSPDTVRWERVCPGTPLIPRGPAGAHDHGCLYGAAYPILRGGELRLYYGGNDRGHSGPRAGFFCLARLRPDGFAALEPTSATEPGTVLTRPIDCVGKRLRVSADAAKGSLRAEVLDAEGLRLADCQPLQADVTDGEVAWRGGADLSGLRGKPIRLRFELRSARLYAFGFSG